MNELNGVVPCHTRLWTFVPLSDKPVKVWPVSSISIVICSAYLYHDIFSNRHTIRLDELYDHRSHRNPTNRVITPSRQWASHDITSVMHTKVNIGKVLHITALLSYYINKFCVYVFIPYTPRCTSTYGMCIPSVQVSTVTSSSCNNRTHETRNHIHHTRNVQINTLLYIQMFLTSYNKGHPFVSVPLPSYHSVVLRTRGLRRYINAESSIIQRWDHRSDRASSRSSGHCYDSVLPRQLKELA